MQQMFPADIAHLRKESVMLTKQVLEIFDLLDRDAYEEKVCGGAHSDLPDAAFPVLVIVKSLD